MLHGINIQYLDGIDTQPRYNNAATRWQRQNHGARASVAQHATLAKMFSCQADHCALDGIFTAPNKSGLYVRMKSQQKNFDAVVNGVDFDGLTACNTLDDQEKVRNYLIRTREIIDTTPELVQGYRNPQEFSDMIGYILRYWDCASREDAISLMARREQLLVEQKKIRTTDQDTTADQYNGRFFGLLAQLMLPKSELSKTLSPLLADEKDKVRAAQSATRRETVDSRGLKTTVTDNAQVGALCGLGTATAAGGEIDYVFGGFDGVPVNISLGYAGVEAYDCNRGYLTALAGYMARHIDDPIPDSQRKVSKRTTERALNAFSDILGAWDISLEAAQLAAHYHAQHSTDDPILHGTLGALDGWFWKAVKATLKLAIEPLRLVGNTIKSGSKLIFNLITDPKNAKRHFGTFGSEIVRAAKIFVNESWKAAKDTIKYGFVEPTKQFIGLTKNIIKFIIRYNPITLVARGILLLAAKKNWFHLATKCYAGTLTQEDAEKQGWDKDNWEKSKKCFSKFLKVFEAIGGRNEKLVSALTGGVDLPPVGPENPTKSALTDMVKTNANKSEKELEATINAERDFDKQYSEERNGTIIEDSALPEDFYEGATIEATGIQHNRMRVVRNTKLWAYPIDEDEAAQKGIRPERYPQAGAILVYDMDYYDPAGKWVRCGDDVCDGYVLKADLETIDDKEGVPVETTEPQQLGDPLGIAMGIITAIGTLWGVVAGIIGFAVQRKQMKAAEQEKNELKAANNKAQAEYEAHMAQIEEDIRNGIRNPDGSLKVQDDNKSASSASKAVKIGVVGLGVLTLSALLFWPKKKTQHNN